MQIADWAQRWSEGKIGFHEGKANELLAKHVGGLGEARRVLVPLCGKAEDMAFLAARGHEIVGIEAVEVAVQAFFREHGLAPSVERGPRGLVFYRAPGITILSGDVFAATNEDVGAVNALYDRAAMVALPADVRPRYVAHLRALLPAGSPGILVTFDYDQSLIDGPPFAVNDAEVRRLYDGAEVTLLATGDGIAPKFEAAKIPISESCYRIVF